MSDSDSDSQSELIALFEEHKTSPKSIIHRSPKHRTQIAPSKLLLGAKEIILQHPDFQHIQIPQTTQNMSLHQQIPNETMSKDELQLLIHTIPRYDNSNLNSFINRIDRLFNRLQNQLTPTLNFILNEQILSKLSPEALSFVECQNAENWLEIKNSLLQMYGDKRSEEILSSELMSCFQSQKETYMEFYAKILRKHSELIQYVNLQQTSQVEKEFQRKNYNQILVRTFKNGLKEPHRSYIFHFNLENIEQCILKCTELDNQIQTNQAIDSRRSAQNKNVIFNKNTIQNTFTPKFQNYTPQQSFIKPIKQETLVLPKITPQRFPAQQGFAHNINKPITGPKQPFTNKQVFGTKPAQTVSQSDRHTPMSISTRNTYKPNYQQRFNAFQPSAPRNFISEELFNTENNDNEQIYENCDSGFTQEPESCENYETEDNYEQNFQIISPHNEET